ncbi:SET domain-containing protein-like protein [Emericellopsis cladophorae]|uniref:SET domain-containing protein-like protein n=1 Tax=Emericellopsis cladophorae TaxID=2686198 RepID=A0A9P9XYM5_9HYPO|nr:SET domain-containing protein-like protein [Emericellopsis cladophorae]KAI6779913.1 SET domain-containing protein-like protein [Emericellopsis cladophorae]
MRDKSTISIAQFNSLSTSGQDQVLSLANICKHGHPVVGIIWTNSIPLTLNGNEAGLFPLASRINHSCVPNTVHSWDEERGELRTHVIRDIQDGEEITSYYPSSVAEYALRQGHFWKFHGFRCACTLCLLPLAEREASDNRIRRIIVLEQSLDLAWQHRRHCTPKGAQLKLVGTLLDLYREEGIADWRPMQALIRGSTLATEMHSDRRATILAERAYKMSIDLRGHDHSQTKQMGGRVIRMKQCLDEWGGYGAVERRPAEMTDGNVDNWLYHRSGPDVDLWGCTEEQRTMQYGR